MGLSDRMKANIEKISGIRKMFDLGLSMKRTFGEENVFDFTLGNPNVEPPDSVDETLIAILQQKTAQKHGYMPNAGYTEVRERIAGIVSAQQQTSLSGASVVMSSGAGGALNIIFNSLLNPGDKVIIMPPCFVMYGAYAANSGGVATAVPLKPDFTFDFKALERAIDSKTAAVVINSPNNPAGFIHSSEELQQLGELLTRKKRETGRVVYLIMDEPYREIVFDNSPIPPLFPHYSHSIIVNSCSKSHSLPGERIGWAAVHPGADEAEELVKGLIAATLNLGFTNAPALMQRFLLEGFEGMVDSNIYQRKRDLLCSALKEIGYTFFKPQGAFYLFVKVPYGDDKEFINRLQEERILAVPGSSFYYPNWFRLAFCVDDKVIEHSIPGFKNTFSPLK